MLKTTNGMVEILSGCRKTKECCNNKCFWRQRNEFGRSPWYWPGDEEGWTLHNLEMDTKYGTYYFPEMTVTVGTNCMYVVCGDFIMEGEAHVS